MLQATQSLFIAVLFAAPSQLEEKALKTPSIERAVERGSPALFSWGDADGDMRLDLAAVSAEGVLQLLANAGEGRFEEVTERIGLSGVANAALALWIDYDEDGRLDLFIGARAGASRLFHNEGGLFVDMTAASGLASEGEVQSAHWLDHDGDGRLDLHVVTAEKNELRSMVFRGLAGGFFERSELPALAGAGVVPVSGGPIVVGELSAPTLSGDPRVEDGMHGGVSIDGSVVVSPTGSRAPLVIAPGSGTSSTSSSGLIASCLPAIRDQANPGACLQASSAPTLGMLHPISANLFVAVGGNVGVGTTTPSTKLEVAGTARVTDTLTLAPAGDVALDVSTGSIYKGGALFLHTKGGSDNTALGQQALASVTSGYRNTASGANALRYNTSGYENTACGTRALLSNTTGYRNTASGFEALRSNTTGKFNTASGFGALRFNTTGVFNTASGAYALHSNRGSANTASGTYALRINDTGFRNTASGYSALYSNTSGDFNTASGNRALSRSTTGDRNIALGAFAGLNLTTGSDNIAIGNYGVAAESATIRLGTAGTHTRAFVAGIRGVTTGNANAIPVLVDSAGQLGTVSSSRRFKEEIDDMGDWTERLLQLRPVVFRYKPEVQSGERPLEYGLIAEEVAEVFPELVVNGEDGQPFTVKYHLLSAMLLNELQETDERVEAQARELEELRSRLAAVEAATLPAPQSVETFAGSR